MKISLSILATLLLVAATSCQAPLGLQGTKSYDFGIQCLLAAQGKAEFPPCVELVSRSSTEDAATYRDTQHGVVFDVVRTGDTIEIVPHESRYEYYMHTIVRGCM